MTGTFFETLDTVVIRSIKVLFIKLYKYQT